MSDKILMEEMTWREVETALNSGKDTVFIMAGSSEQHGPHLPAGTDAMLGYERGVRLARALGNALVAPVIRPGLSEHHMHFPGTITLTPETFKSVVFEYCRSLVQHSFKNIIIVPTHGGNYGATAEVVPALREAFPDVKVVYLGRDDSKDAHPIIREKLEVDPLRAGVHAGQVETAMMLVHRPDLVQMEHAPEGWLGEFDDETSKQLTEEGIQSLSEVGVLGDARDATTELGEAYLTEWTNIYVDLIRERLKTDASEE